MIYETILYRTDSDVATITLNRPDKLNALSAQMRVDLSHAIGIAQNEARALVLTGAGRAFCSGQDLGEEQSIAKLDLRRMLRDEYAPLIATLTECSIPTIAAVNGNAAGGGANLALAADIVVAAGSASFLQAFTRIGLMPDVGGTYFLPRLIGRSRAMGAALLAEEISARQAEEWGMIWEVVADHLFPDHIDALARRLADGPTEAYRQIKIAMRASDANDLSAQLELEAESQGKLGETRDFIEGVTAFLEKRPAKFEGR